MRTCIQPFVYFWGQEMEIWRAACRRAGAIPETIDWPTIHAIVSAEIGVPLIVPDRPDYPARIAAAARCWAPAGTGAWCA